MKRLESKTGLAFLTAVALAIVRDNGFSPPNNIGLTNGLGFVICP